MKKNYDEPDMPVEFDEQEKSEEILGKRIPNKRVEYIEKLADATIKLDENNRKNGAVKLIVFILIAMCVLTVLNSIENMFGLNGPLVSELFEFFKYIGTTLIGYLYANSGSKES